MNWRAIAGRSFLFAPYGAIVGKFAADVAAPLRRGKPAPAHDATVDNRRNPPETLPTNLGKCGSAA
jgi:hypothetical protein